MLDSRLNDWHRRRQVRSRWLAVFTRDPQDDEADEIAQAIAQCNQFQLADVLIVGRGGGSLEDLWAFNEEQVAAAIFHSHRSLHQSPRVCSSYLVRPTARRASTASEGCWPNSAWCSRRARTPARARCIPANG